MLTAIEHGSVGPKRMVKTISESKAVFTKVYEFRVCVESADSECCLQWRESADLAKIKINIQNTTA